jgi:2-oxo-3-hexenedioate decarboxylase
MRFSRIVINDLIDAFDHGTLIPSIVGINPHFGIDAAYTVAADLVRMRRARGEKTIGRKVGFTNRNIWPQYGATAPIWAHVYDRTVQYAETEPVEISLKGSIQPRLEPEIAFKLKTPLRPGQADPARILEAIEWLAPSFEIVDCHFADWKFSPADSVADFSLHWRLIIGRPVAVVPDTIARLVEQLRDCGVALDRNGETMDRGVGANALGHPALALAFLADIVQRQPQFEPLAAGEVITTGTLTAAMPVAPGETWSSRYEGLPGVTGLSIAFTD